MALADTAKLVATLELQDKFTGPARKAEGSISSLDRKMGTLGKSAGNLGAGLGRAVGTIAKIGVGVAAGGIALLTVNIKAGVDALAELESAVVQTQTVIKSTGGVAGQSADDIRKLSEHFEGLNAAMDDVAIQGGANMLLTFTNIGPKAFEPALQAVLDLNQAMGKGPEGLQSTAIQVGKALNDPTRGLTALRKVGVSFTEQQKEQIKTLQEAGDLYGAQQIIIEELGKEFGGQFAAAGQTAEGRMAKLGDTIQDLQKRLAGPLLPAIDRVREKLIAILSTDRAGQAAEKIGDAIASIFTQPNIDAASEKIGGLLDKISGFDTSKLDDANGLLGNLSGTVAGLNEGGSLSGIGATIKGIAEQVAKLPWQAIGDAAKLLGTGSKALLDAFLGLPPWVQTAVLTGWGLNKLTGGALGTIVNTLASGLIKGILGINAGVVNLTAGTVTGPGGGIPPAAPILGGLGLGGLATLIVGSLGTILGGGSALSDLGDPEQQGSASLDLLGGFPTLIGRAVTDALVASGLITDPNKPAPVTDDAGTAKLEDLDASIADVNRRLEEANTSNVTNRSAVIAALRAEKEELLRNKAAITNSGRLVADEQRRQIIAVKRGFDDNGSKIVRFNRGIDGVRDTVRTGNAHLAVIRNKKTSVNVTASITNQVNVSAANVQNAVQAYTFTTGGRTFVY